MLRSEARTTGWPLDAIAGIIMFIATVLASTSAFASSANGNNTDASYTSQEKRAVDVVTRLIAAAKMHDPDLIGSFMTDKVVFKPTPDAVDIVGRAAVVAELRKFLKNPVVDQLVMADGPGRIVTMGGQTGTAVLVWRQDFVKGRDGSLASLPVAAAVWVVGDKVQSWYDWPLGADPTGNNWGAVTH